jgi:hypothetical protein
VSESDIIDSSLMNTSAGGVGGLSVEASYALYSFYGLGRRQSRGNICVRHAFYTAAHAQKKSVSAAAFVLSEGLMNVTNIKIVYPNLSSSTSTRSAWSPCSSFCVSICTFILVKQVI